MEIITGRYSLIMILNINSKHAIDFLKNKKVDFIDWSPNSPDLNPIEMFGV